MILLYILFLNSVQYGVSMHIEKIKFSDLYGGVMTKAAMKLVARIACGIRERVRLYGKQGVTFQIGGAFYTPGAKVRVGSLEDAGIRVDGVLIRWEKIESLRLVKGIRFGFVLFLIVLLLGFVGYFLFVSFLRG